MGCTAATASAVFSTTSATFVIITGMTLVLPAGSYFIVFSSDNSSTVASAQWRYAIFINGVESTISGRRYHGNGGDHMVAYTNLKVTLLMTSTITVQVRKLSAAPATLTFEERSLTALF
jgi:hypothetical protein